MIDRNIINDEQVPKNLHDVIMVAIDDYLWTQEALHRACAMARKTGATVALLKLIDVQHAAWLGTEFGEMNLSARDEDEMDEHIATLEDYGADFCLHLFQYITFVEAIGQAADYVKAQIVFATTPKSWIPYWHEFQQRRLRRLLAHDHRELVEVSFPAGQMLHAGGYTFANGNEHRSWHVTP